MRGILSTRIFSIQRYLLKLYKKIILYTAKKPEPGKSLLFIDEIQECPGAIVSLRYFFEELPWLHVIGAGSLLEFAISSEDFRMPVGRIQYLYLYPMSFGEFLDALGESELKHYISDISKLEHLTPTLHDKLNGYVRKYFIIGGMPAVVKEYITSQDIIKCVDSAQIGNYPQIYYLRTPRYQCTPSVHTHTHTDAFMPGWRNW